MSSRGVVALLLASRALGQTIPQAEPPRPPSNPPPGNETSAAGRILQDGIPIKLQLRDALSSSDARVGQKIHFEVVDDIDIDGVTVLHRGAAAIGVVVEAEARKRMGRAGKLSFTIDSVQLADGEKVALRAVNDTKGESRVKGMTMLMVSVVPMAAAPFMLLIKGGDTSIPRGTKITAFVDGDKELDLARFGPVPPRAAPAEPRASLVVESVPAGADIELDGVLVGSTPFTASVARGRHRISVKKKGFTDWSKTFDVAGDKVRVNAVLEQVQ